jgi:two-component system, chemotaxis family, response regulator Rcp1
VIDLSNQKAIEILLVEDNPGDARLTAELLRDSGISIKINHVRDGVQALALLRREGAYREAPQMELLLLDLNLPRVDGREMLTQIKRDPKLRTIPVVVLTGSHDEVGLRKSLAQADSFMVKPVDTEKLVVILASLRRAMSSRASPGWLANYVRPAIRSSAFRSRWSG